MSEAPQALQETETPGAVLAERRAARGLSVPDVANRLKFASRQIEALEAGEYGKLPGGTFVRGMIRGYARLLEIDPEPLVRALERSHAPEPVAVEMHSESIPFPDGRTSTTRIYLSLSALIILAVGAILYEGHFGMPQMLVRKEPAAPVAVAPPEVAAKPAAPAPAVPAAPPAVPQEAAPAPASPASAPVVPASASGAAVAGSRLQFQFGDESWVEVRDRAGKVLTSDLNPAGSTRTVQGDPPFALVIGNASSVHLSYRDRPVDLKPYTKVEVARLTLE